MLTRIAICGSQLLLESGPLVVLMLFFQQVCTYEFLKKAAQVDTGKMCSDGPDRCMRGAHISIAATSDRLLGTLLMTDEAASVLASPDRTCIPQAFIL